MDVRPAEEPVLVPLPFRTLRIERGVASRHHGSCASRISFQSCEPNSGLLPEFRLKTPAGLRDRDHNSASSPLCVCYQCLNGNFDC